MSLRVDEASGPLSLSPAPSPTSSTSSTSSLDALLAAEDLNPLPPPPQITAHRVIFGRNVIQVPLKQAETTEYVNLVLSQLEFDVMAVHVPQYEELPPEELLERITQLLKEQETKKRQRLGSSSSITSNDPTDSLAAFQGRLLELEYERKRLQTKVKGAKALQINLTEENTALRVQLEQAEQQAVDIEELLQENELLRYQTLHLGSDVAKWENVAIKAVQELRTLKQELIALKKQVQGDRDETALTVEDAMAMLVEDVNRREQVLQQSYLAEKREREVMAEKYYELSGKEFAFDQMFGPHSTQAEVYTQVEPLVSSFTDGYNACIMAYGQTGSGKTHTMVGNEQGALEHRANGLTVHSNAGMIPRALQHVFAMVKKRQMTYVDSLRVSMVEIYNDQILDLLHEDSTRGGKNAVAKSETDITAREVNGYAQVDAVMRDGNANRNIAATKMNLESSRSHALVFLHLESQHRETREVRTSTLCLVDLAGSERISRSQVEGERLRETQHINKSLAALGDVVYALQHKAKHTPYRNSKLTYMLRDMLSGQAKTLLMLQLSPDAADVEETTCSLQFGARVSQVQMGAVKPSVQSGALFKLQEDNRALEAKTQAMEAQLNELLRRCQQQGDELHEAHSSKEAIERQLWLLGGRQRGGKASDELEQGDYTPEARSPSPSRPPSPTPSAKSSRSVSSATSARSARPMRSVRSVQSTTTSSQRPTTRRSQTTSTSRVSGTPRTGTASGSLTPSPVSRLRRPESMVEREERRKSLSAASRDRIVDPDLRRKSLSASSASRIADQDNRRNSLSTLQTRSMSGLATPRSLRTKEAASPESRVPLHPPSRTPPAPARQSAPAGRLSRQRSAKAVGSSTPPASSPSSNSSTENKPARTLHRAALTPSRASSRTPTRTSASATDERRSSLNKTRSAPSSTPSTSRRALTSSQSGFGWK
ncbi:kinesin-like protein [Phytophthora infestans T30-4]|uniref:Kinesin-like protein n=1 Tax=Phytophthora infestans (strain T30-4) TaxID=403677 RepID=D0MR94_PHYIT|nr:kinesin-like protein [Phytophthora infestans T30-4]EEY58013.1 kinesin-like protein [Phytophthora infestans T30-4]|eukprot:XP_002909199.1 kinesin-like protein [Phytophthora infestans T30-4]